VGTPHGRDGLEVSADQEFSVWRALEVCAEAGHASSLLCKAHVGDSLGIEGQRRERGRVWVLQVLMGVDEGRGRKQRGGR
jgi:hypothetical protein